MSLGRVLIPSGGGFSVTYRQTIRNMARSTADFLGTIDRLPEIHQRLSSVIIEHKDALELLEKYNAPDVFMYLDPPYVKKTRKSNQTYECELSDFDHERLVDLCLNFKGKILLSGYDNPIYDRLLPTFEKVELYDAIIMGETDKVESLRQELKTYTGRE